MALAALLTALISAPAMSQDMIVPEMTIHDFFGMEPVEFMKGIHGRDVAAKTVKFARIDIVKDASTPYHNHPDEQFVLVLEGSIKAKSGDKEYILTPGQLMMVPAYVDHTYTALEDSVTIEVFGPGRPF